jgi:FkbM family methyltransferase
VGANVGAYTLLFGQWVRPGGRVYAFEPAPDAFAGLVRHVELNGLTDVVTFVRAAAGERSGTVRIVSEGIAGTNRVASAADDAAGEEVRAVSLDDFCAREGITPALVKIDVEGWELEVLRGARETLRRGGDGLALFVELHPAAFRELGMTSGDVAAALDDLGLRIEPLGPCDDPLALEGECLRLRPK